MSNSPKPGLHPKNIHRFGYDFGRLAKDNAALNRFVKPNAYGNISIDFADPEAVLALNKALLKTCHQIQNWDIPKGNLCPPIPGRADYLYYIADLLAGSEHRDGGGKIRALDIGTGASGIYPLIGASLFGWKFVATDIEKSSIENLKSIISKNPLISQLITCRLQTDPNVIFQNIWPKDEFFDFTMCNPPFHASAKEAAQSAQRKNKNLGLNSKSLNFGGKNNELWCPGGEKRFVSNMIRESALYKKQCKWFTTLISKNDSLPDLLKMLKDVKVSAHQIIEMAQGQKKSRILAWTFIG